VAVLTISVVIATHNRASLLRATLERLQHQAFEAGDEVIVIDNASTDTTSQVIAEAARGFTIPLHLRHDPAPGKAPAMNAAIAHARGDVLALTDDDVLVSADWVATIRGLFSESSMALVGGRVDPHWQRPAPAWLQVEHQGRYGPLSSPLALLHYGEAQNLGKRTAVGANMAVRRSVFEALGGFAPHLGKRRGTLLCGEDHVFCVRAVGAGYRCEYRPELRVQHWVPAERTKVRYFLRWFFWSGITNAIIDSMSGTAAERGANPSPRHLLRRFCVGTISAPIQALSGRAAQAALQATDAAFALGYLSTLVSSRWRLDRHGGLTG
jgi:GT2 family glycosyltransferase